MRNILCFLIVALFTSSLRSAEETALRSIIDAPGRLPESIQQEAIAATDRAARYLAKRQLPDGTWEGLSSAESDRLALAARTSPIPEAVNTFNQRVIYAEAHPLATSTTIGDIDAICARAILLAAADKADKAWQTLSQLKQYQLKSDTPANGAIADRKQPTRPASDKTQFIAAEALWALQALLPPPPKEMPCFDSANFSSFLQATNATSPELALAQVLLLPEQPSSVTGAVYRAQKRLPLEAAPQQSIKQLGIEVALISSVPQYTPDRLSLKNGEIVDWRQKVAEALIASQRIDPSTGHGFWQPRNDATPAERMTTTADALRLLAEL